MYCVFGRFKVSAENLKPLHQQCQDHLLSIARKLRKVSALKITHVLRAGNKEADRLANVAMDSKATTAFVDEPELESASVCACGNHCLRLACTKDCTHKRKRSDL